MRRLGCLTLVVAAALGAGLSGAVVSCVGAGLERPLAGSAGVRLELVAEGLNAPVFLVSPPDGSGRRFIGEQSGLVYVLTADGRRLDVPFLDLRKQLVELLQAFDERGLLGLAFHPSYARNGLFYVTYSAPPRRNSKPSGSTASTRRVSEFRVSPVDPNRADPSTERILMELDWVNRKHNGGGLAFGPDGYLYIGLGDGGGAHGFPEVVTNPLSGGGDDAFIIPKQFHEYDRYAQDTQRLYGKILRIDVDEGKPGYAIPATNIFLGKSEGLAEIYAWGFRNPFRISFDRAGTGDLFVSGVAETFWETVYLVNGQGNYGWAAKEGTHCFLRARAFDPPAECPSTGSLGEPIHDPIIEYANWAVERSESKVKAKPQGSANVGGYLYRGKLLPALYGKFVFGDFSEVPERPSGLILAATPSPVWGEMWSLQRLLEIDVRVHGLGEDAEGELYVLSTAQGIPVGNTGKVFKIVPAGS